MQLEYETNLADVAEVHVRFFQRSKTFKKSRVKSSLVCSLYALGGMYLASRNSDHEIDCLAFFLAAFAGIFVFCISKRTSRRRIFKCIKREHGDLLPCTTKYTLDDQRLTCESFGVDLSFSLDDLEEVVEQKEDIEISFGSRGLCVVPNRAFDSESHKSAFLSAVRQES